jgi:hypothetical protein
MDPRIQPLSVGPHTIDVTFSGDANFDVAHSPQFTQQVDRAESTLSFSTTPAGPTFIYGQDVTVTAAISAVPPGAGTPGGNVTFIVDNGTPQPMTLDLTGRASITLVQPSVGTHHIQLSYDGDTNFQPTASANLHRMEQAEAVLQRAAASLEAFLEAAGDTDAAQRAARTAEATSAALARLGTG